MDEPIGCSTRSLAIGGLAAYGVTVLLIILTLAYPLFGSGGPSLSPMYFPPQAILGSITGLFTISVALGLAVRCFAISVRGRQRAWLPVFALLSLAALLGPILLLLQVHLSQATWNVVALISGLGVLLTLLAALLYTLPTRPPQSGLK
jgi:hypothetical protein